MVLLRLFLSCLRAENVRREVTNVASIVTKMWGALPPQFLFKGTMDPPAPFPAPPPMCFL